MTEAYKHDHIGGDMLTKLDKRCIQRLDEEYQNTMAELNMMLSGRLSSFPPKA